MTEISTTHNEEDRPAYRPGDIVKHRDGLTYRVIGDTFLIKNGKPYPAVQYVQLEQGGMPPGSTWTREASEMTDERIFTPMLQEDLADEIAPLERATSDEEPPIGTLLEGNEQVVGHGYDVTGYEQSHTFAMTVRVVLIAEKYGLPAGTEVEKPL